MGTLLVVHSVLNKCVLNPPCDIKKPADEQPLLWDYGFEVLG
jgi:hypothetical protein